MEIYGIMSFVTRKTERRTQRETAKRMQQHFPTSIIYGTYFGGWREGFSGQVEL